MATSFFHEETIPTDDDTVMELVRYYYDDIAAEVLTRSFHLFPATAEKNSSLLTASRSPTSARTSRSC